MVNISNIICKGNNKFLKADEKELKNLLKNNQ